MLDVYNYNNPLLKYFYSVTNGLYVGTSILNHLNFNPVTLKIHKGIFF